MNNPIIRLRTRYSLELEANERKAQLCRSVATAMLILFGIGLLVMLSACVPGAAPGSLTSPAALTGDVRDVVAIGLDVYPAGAPEVDLAKNLICAEAGKTNVSAAVIIADLQQSGITNSNIKLIVDGVLIAWNRIVPFIGTNVQAYGDALCLGLQEGTGQGPAARKMASKLPAHWR